MRPKRRGDPDGQGLPPFDVLRGEWWAERRRELADAGRRELEQYLDERGIRHEASEMYWLRMRCAYAGMLEFYADHGAEVPPRMLGRVAELDRRRPRAQRRTEVDIFRDLRAVVRQQEAANEEAALVAAREEA